MASVTIDFDLIEGDCGPRKGVVEILSRLKQHGHTIYVLGANRDGIVGYLNEHGIPFDGIESTFIPTVRLAANAMSIESWVDSRPWLEAVGLLPETPRPAGEDNRRNGSPAPLPVGGDVIDVTEEEMSDAIIAVVKLRRALRALM